MSDSYNLDAQAPENFEFTLGGNVYRMRYPTTEEITQAQKMEDELEQLEWIYGFIDPIDEKAPAVKEVLDKVNLKVMQRFNAMIKTEFSAE